MIETTLAQSDLTTLTTELVAAYVAKNSVPVGEIPNLIRSVHQSLSMLGASPTVDAPTAPLVPAVPIKKSVTDDYIISLEDGRKFKSLKRYLATSHGMTPADYRAKWGLPSDYPMVAPAYAAKRSELARSIGLGRKASADVVQISAPETREPQSVMSEPVPAEAPKKRRRTKKAG